MRLEDSSGNETGKLVPGNETGSLVPGNETGNLVPIILGPVDIHIRNVYFRKVWMIVLYQQTCKLHLDTCSAMPKTYAIPPFGSKLLSNLITVSPGAILG